MLFVDSRSLHHFLANVATSRNNNDGLSNSSIMGSKNLLVPLAATTLSVYATIELGFYVYYHKYLYPKGNALTTPTPYPGIYARNRIALLNRMLDRMERTCRMSGQCMIEYMTEYFRLMVARDENCKDAFLEDEDNNVITNIKLSHLSSTLSDNSTNTSLTRTSVSDSISCSSSEQDDDDEEMFIETSLATTSRNSANNSQSSSSSTTTSWLHPLLHKGDCDRALAFGFFAKDYNDLEDWELEQVNEMYVICERRFGVTFREGFTKGYYVRRTTLDPIDTLHRPLSYYALVQLTKTMGNNVLRLLGFRRYKSKTTPLVCWHRPPSSYNTKTNTTKFLPTLFFHGIAPAGLPMYLPMILYGLLYEEDRPVFLFETPYIASTLGFNNVITKQDTVAGVKEILDLFPYTKNTDQPLSIMGHSFGSFVSTWCVYDETLRQRIKQLTLLDPVSILLSEPDVMNSFDNPGFLFWLFGTSELHVNHYVRRQFRWYTSELWLDDIPEHTHTLIGLAHEDPIVNSPKVKRDILTYTIHNMSQKPTHDTHKFQKQTKILYWYNATHGYCLMFPKVWKQMKDAHMDQELQILKQQQQKQQQQQQQQTGMMPCI